MIVLIDRAKWLVVRINGFGLDHLEKKLLHADSRKLLPLRGQYKDKGLQIFPESGHKSEEERHGSRSYNQSTLVRYD